MADIDEFLAARDFLMRHRDDYATAYESFRWPSLTRFNWALDYFDRIEDGRQVDAGAPPAELPRQPRQRVRLSLGEGQPERAASLQKHSRNRWFLHRHGETYRVELPETTRGSRWHDVFPRSPTAWPGALSEDALQVAAGRWALVLLLGRDGNVAASPRGAHSSAMSSIEIPAPLLGGRHSPTPGSLEFRVPRGTPALSEPD